MDVGAAAVSRIGEVSGLVFWTGVAATGVGEVIVLAVAGTDFGDAAFATSDTVALK